MYVMIRHALMKEEALPAVKEAYESAVMGPVVNARATASFACSTASRGRGR